MNWEIIEKVTLTVASLALILLAAGALAPGRLHTAILQPLRRAVDVQPGEVRALFFSAVYFFFTLASYSLLRPIRDEMAVASGARDLPFLFAYTLGAMLLANPIYSALVGRFSVRRFVSIVYVFFALNLVVFYLLWRAHANDMFTGRVFFAWTSVYALFVPSIFWGVMADTFHHTQAKRLFGFIAVGGTLGFITGASLTAFLAQRIGVPNLLLISASFLMIALALVLFFPTVRAPEGAPAANERSDHLDTTVGGSLLAGMAHTLRSPYLAGIAGFLLLYTIGSTVLYAAQVDIMGEYFSDRAQRTAIIARLEVVTQSLTAIGQAFLTARIIRVAGLSVTLAAVPAVSILGFAALGATAWGILPLLGTFFVFSVARRTTEFILTNPSRKILFTVMKREDKYKATNFLETFVYRAGDQVAVWGYAGLIALGLVLTGIVWIAVPFSALYLALGVWLGKKHRQLADSSERSTARDIRSAADGAPAIPPRA